MSRIPTISTALSRAPASTSDATNALPTDFCPVCKRVRYLNTSMKFQINPECYHAMCSQCVDNIFKSGPTQCPYPACKKTLRYKGFHEAYFGDLAVEREVDIRRRVTTVFNNTQDDFETLRDYNDYLQKVEDLTFDLVNGGEEERKRGEKELLAWEQQHKAEIEKNKKKGRDIEVARVRRLADAEAASKRRKAEQQREEAEARDEEAKLNREVMEALSRGETGGAAAIQEKILAKKKAKLAQINASHFSASLDAQAPSLSIRGLRQKKTGPSADEEDLDKPYDPFAGVDLAPGRFVLRDNYENPFLDAARTKEDHRVPGYNVQEYVSRAMFEAFAGLGVMIDDEKADNQRTAGTAGAREAAERNKTTGSLATGLRMEVDDVFV
jgi:CDK-activating kinase assembly factor MAT1